MSTHWHAAFAGAIAIVMAAPGVMADEWVRDSAGNMLVPPTPATAERLFNPIQEAKNPDCPKKEEVIRHYILSDSELKSGNVKLLVGELPQAFADAWRQRLHMKPIAVSAVVAQPLDLSRLGGGSAFDVTEFGADGCAFSRTVMPAAIWRDMLRAAVGVSV
jgi:hypothetical protein